MCCIKNQVKVHIVHIFHIYFTDTLYPFPPHFYFNNNKYYKYNIYYYWEEERVLEGVYVENVEYVYYVYLVSFSGKCLEVSGKLRTFASCKHAA